jgi:hypothetical protein
MATKVEMIFEPFVRRGLFPTPERAAQEMARDFVMRQIERHRTTIEQFEAKYGMNYRQFNEYLAARAGTLATSPSPALNQALMDEEEAALRWKVATEMLDSWLGINREVGN